MLWYNKAMEKEQARCVHFIGIGGIGMSALARFYHSKGWRISGSDLQSSEITEELAKEGMQIAIGRHKAANVPKEATLVIRTAATPLTNVEVKRAITRGIPVRLYAEELGVLTRQYRTVTISGSHGKSTTTALTALVMQEGSLDPTVILGTKLKEFGNSNFRRGKGSYFVLEADEYNRSFLHFSPQIAIVTNIDAEHLDTYKTVEGVEQAFKQYLEKIPKDGVIIANHDDERLRRVAGRFNNNVVWYSLESPEADTVRAIIQIPGDHNVSNALAALMLGRTLGIPEHAILSVIGRYRGAWRRFEFKGMINGGYIYNDYGHHPSEIRATLAAARATFPFRRVLCVFQPHQYARLAYNWDGFIQAFDGADRVILLPVYEVAGRDAKKAKHTVNSEKLAHELILRGKNAAHLTFEEAPKEIPPMLRQGDVVLMMGAGNIYDLTNEMVSQKESALSRPLPRLSHRK